MSSIKNESKFYGKFNKNRYYFRFTRAIAVGEVDTSTQMNYINWLRNCVVQKIIFFFSLSSFTLIYLLLKAIVWQRSRHRSIQEIMCAMATNGENKKKARSYFFLLFFAMIIIIIFNLFSYFNYPIYSGCFCFMAIVKIPMERSHKPVNDELKIFISFDAI